LGGNPANQSQTIPLSADRLNARTPVTNTDNPWAPRKLDIDAAQIAAGMATCVPHTLPAEEQQQLELIR